MRDELMPMPRFVEVGPEMVTVRRRKKLLLSWPAGQRFPHVSLVIGDQVRDLGYLSPDQTWTIDVSSRFTLDDIDD